MTCVPEKDLFLLRFGVVSAQGCVSGEDDELVQN